MRKILFIDRDGTIIKEAPPTYQIDDWGKLEFYPGMFQWLAKLAARNEYELVMISNQDGLGTASFPSASFWPIQHFIMRSLENEGIKFSEVLIDHSLPAENSPNRKPRTGMLVNYISDKNIDWSRSYVIGDRVTDLQLATNLGCRSIWLNNDDALGAGEINGSETWRAALALETNHWKEIYEFLTLEPRVVIHERNTNETKIRVELDLDSKAGTKIDTGLSFFDHMLEQLSRHGNIGLRLQVKGDLHIDEHHTIEDTALALGEAFALALGDKKGIGRYAFSLPMDDCLALVAIDLGGRPWLVWETAFKREKIGDMPTEMFFHFFKSFSDAAKCNLNIKAEGTNEHHKIESIFKAFARVLRQAVKRDPENMELPSTKGVL